jgi:hypothetical protein
MLFGILNQCDSITEVCEGLRAIGGKFNHSGMNQASAKNTASDGLRIDKNLSKDLHYINYCLFLRVNIH